MRYKYKNKDQRYIQIKDGLKVEKIAINIIVKAEYLKRRDMRPLE